MATKRVSVRAANRLKDEVYRQMLRLEAGHTAAQLPLALALLQAWIRLGDEPLDSETRQWLQSIGPLCLRMIERASASRTHPPVGIRSRIVGG